jgi:hypothetical protein
VPANPSAAPKVAVVGGGPAGLIAAERLAIAGCTVDVYEHMPSVGRKLLLAGRSGLNLTHSEPLADMLARYGDAPLVHAAVRAFDPNALRAWARGLGQPTFVGSSGRVFPEAMRATPLLRAWLARLAELGVQIHVRSASRGWSVGDQSTTLRVQSTSAGQPVVTSDVDAIVLAMGGASWPRVGSDGGWTAQLRAAGVEVAPLRPANCGLQVAWTPSFADRFAGQPLKNVAVTVGGAAAVRGDVTITSTGMESGPIYTVSSTVRDALAATGACVLTIDLHPDSSVADLVARLARRRPKDSLTNTLRRTLGLVPAAIGLLREATGNDLPHDATALAELVKAVPVAVSGIEPLARAISTAGGIALAEVDERFMLRRLPGVFVAGEMLDWEAPTGGYLLQASFSTGVAAAAGAAAWLGLDDPTDHPASPR